MKKIFTLCLHVFLILSLTAQESGHSESFKNILSHSAKNQTIPDKKSFTEKKSQLTLHAFTDNEILDSIIRFQYITQNDSIRLTKDEFSYNYPESIVSVYYMSWNEESNQWENAAKAEYQYFEDTPLINYWYEWNWDNESGTWINDQRWEYTFDENGFETSVSYFMWNTDIDRWDKRVRSTKENNDEGRPLVSIGWKSDEYNEWLQEVKIEKVYNEDGRTNTRQRYTWSEEADGWINQNKTHYYHNQDGLVVNDTTFKWADDAWGFSSKTEFSYTETGMILLKVYSEYDSNIWIYHSKNEYDYDENDRPIYGIYSRWLENEWRYQSKSEYQYDGIVSLDFISNWDWEQNMWVYSFKREYEIDSVNFSTMLANYKWEYEWVGYYRSNRDYNENWDPMVDIRYNWSDVDKNWIVDIRDFFYRSPVASMAEYPVIQASVFPNPTTGILKIQSRSNKTLNCSLMAINGQEMLYFDVSGMTESIDISDLPMGIYLLRLSHGSETEIKRIVKK